MPLEMRPRRPIFAQAGNPPAIASSAGAVPTPAGGAPGAVPAPSASGARPTSAPPGSVGLGPTSGVTQLGKGQQNSSGALGAGALGGSQPLGGTRTTTAGNVGLGSSMPARSQALAANYGQLGGATARSAPDAQPPLSRGTGGGGTARTTSARGQTAEEAAAEAQTIRDVGAGRPKDSSLMPVGGAAPKIPGAVSGPGAEPRGGPVGGVRQPGQASGPVQQTLGYKEGDVEANDAAGRGRTGLFENGIFVGEPAGSSSEGYSVFKSKDGEYWAESQQGWTYMGRNPPNGASTVDPAAPAGEPPPSNGFATNSTGLTGNDSGQGRRYSNQGAPPPAGAFGGTTSGLTGNGGQGRGGGQPASGQAGGGQGYSPEAGTLATSTGQDPFLIQALLDMGISASSITSEGVVGVEDGDFGGGDTAEWNDVQDDEAGKLYAAGQKAAKMRADWGAQQGQQNVDARIEQLLARIGQMQPPGINQGIVQGQVDANRARLMEEQSRTLGASMTSAAASGLSPEAQQAGGYQMMKDYGIAGAQQEAQTRMSAEMANLQGRQMQYAQQINMLNQLLTLPMLSAQQAMGIQAQLAQLQNSMNAEKEMATWQTNQVTAWDFGRELLGAGAQGAITAGSNWLGGKLGG